MADFRHLQRMTDEAGILQFSILDRPDPQSGYTLDDNARGLIVALLGGNAFYHYARSYVHYMEKALHPDGTWSNLLVNGNYYHHLDSEDSLGRAIMASAMGATSEWTDISRSCLQMLKLSLPRAESFTSPRALAYILIALCQGSIPGYPEKKREEIVSRYSRYLAGFYKSNCSHNWKWFENHLTYCNAILPQAMFKVYMFNSDKKMLKIGYESINFLCQILFRTGYLNIIGNQGWYSQNQNIPLFDQQPVDACSIALACLDAYQAIGQNEYREQAELARRWYYGLNIHHSPLYNKATGGCYDALTIDGVNLNQGAESLLSLLLTELSCGQNLTAITAAEKFN